MRTAAVLLTLLLLSSPVTAEDEEDLVEFTGLRDLDPDDLLSAGSEDLEDVYALLHKGAPEDEILAYGEDAAFEMLLFIRKDGYPLSGITVELTAGRMRFTVAPGPQVFLGEFVVRGVTEEIREELGKYVQTPRTWIFGSQLYVRSALDGAARRMEGYLRQHGYYDAEVTRIPSTVLQELIEHEERPEELTVDVEYEVEQGPLHLLETVRLTGNLVRTKEQILDYETEPGGRTIRWLLGRPYGPFTPFDVKAIVTEFYGKQGYPFVEITENVSFDPRGKTTAAIVDLEIREGPKTRIRAVHIFGNLRTGDTVIRREVGLLPGDFFNITAAAETQRRLVETGLFRQVFVDVVPPEEKQTADAVDADLTITLQENEFRRLETMVGWGTWELLRGAVSMTWRNMWGQAYEGSVSLEGSVRGYRLAGHLKDPWALPDFLWDRTAFIAEGFVENKQRPTFSYVREEVGLILRQRDFFDDTVTSFGYAFSRTDVYDVTDDLPEEFENQTNIGRLTLSIIRDTRDNPWSPSSGSALGGSLDYPGSPRRRPELLAPHGERDQVSRPGRGFCPGRPRDDRRHRPLRRHR